MLVDGGKQLLTKALGFNQMTEFANCRLVWCWLAAQIDPNEVTHRGAVIQRIFHRRVRQVEPDLQKINAKQPVSANRRAAAIALRIVRFDQPAQLAPRHNQFHLSQKPLPARLFAVEVKTNT
jgi:hypothetical protein